MLPAPAHPLRLRPSEPAALSQNSKVCRSPQVLCGCQTPRDVSPRATSLPMARALLALGLASRVGTFQSQWKQRASSLLAPNDVFHDTPCNKGIWRACAYGICKGGRWQAR